MIVSSLCLLALCCRSRYAHRSFGMAHWRSLQQSLRLLRKNIAVVVDTVQRNKGPTVSAAASATAAPKM